MRFWSWHPPTGSIADEAGTDTPEKPHLNRREMIHALPRQSTALRLHFAAARRVAVSKQVGRCGVHMTTRVGKTGSVRCAPKGNAEQLIDWCHGWKRCAGGRQGPRTQRVQVSRHIYLAKVPCMALYRRHRLPSSEHPVPIRGESNQGACNVDARLMSRKLPLLNLAI